MDESFLLTSTELRSGDWLRMHCVFNSSHRDFITVYGRSNGNEMCIALVIFTPALSGPESQLSWADTKSKDMSLEQLERIHEWQHQSEGRPNLDKENLAVLHQDYRSETLFWAGFDQAWLESKEAAELGWTRERESVNATPTSSES